ncbi:MAG TPA: hypothetical protein VLS25_04660 [Dehalococcoidia bacterium]|nr:hypothetical protein [Dehalococcoidia bacterium]
MEDRFIGYRGSQENEWSWEPDKVIGPGTSTRHGRRSVMFAAVAAIAVVAIVVAAVYLIAGTGGGNGGAVANANTPTRRPAVSVTAAPTTAPVTQAPTLSPSPSPSPVPATTQATPNFFLWNSVSGKWQSSDLQKDSSGFTEGDSVLFLYKLDGVHRGQTYEIVIDYFDCGLSPGQSFDHLGPMPSTGDAPQMMPPGPGRARPDAQVPVPDDPGVGHDGGPGSLLTVWGGTFPHSPAWEMTPAECAGDKRVKLQVTAQSSTIELEWAGHLAAAKDWPGEGAASAKTSFGMTVTARSLPGTRIQVLPGAVTR